MQKSLIDLVKIQMLPGNQKSDIEFINEDLLPLLKKCGIKQSYSKANLKYFNQGFLLFADDETNAVCGSIKWDGKTKYIQLELSGNGCYYFSTRDEKFTALYNFSQTHQGKVIEVDIAVDDHSGKYNLRRMNQDYCAGKFNGSRGRKPVRKRHDIDGAKSILIGSSSSIKQIQIYDKSREQDLALSDVHYNNWTRIEITYYRRAGAKIPLDCLLKPDEYFVGAYPKSLSKVIKGVTPRCIIREQSAKKAVDIFNSISACKLQWGPTINLLSRIVGDKSAALDVLKRGGLPKSYKLPSYLSEERVFAEVKASLLSLTQ